MAIIPLICILQTQGNYCQGGCGCNPALPRAEWRKASTTTPLLPDIYGVPDQWHLWPVFVKRVRTWVHCGPVITSLHCGHTWMYRLYWHCISVALVRAHCVYAGFDSPSAAGGNAPSSKKPAHHPLEKAFEEGWAGSTDTILTQYQLFYNQRSHLMKLWQEASATAPLERSRQRGVWSWPALANLPSGEGTGGCILLLQILVSALSECVFMWIKAEKAQQQQGRRQDGAQSLRVSLCSSIWKWLHWTKSLKEVFTQHTASAVLGGWDTGWGKQENPLVSSTDAEECVLKLNPDRLNDE